MNRTTTILLLCVLASVGVAGEITPALAVEQPRKQVALIAGPATHTFGEHEHYAGLKLLGDLLNENVPSVRATAYPRWPESSQVLTNVAAIIVCADGLPDNPLVAHLAELEPLMARGVGLGVMHWTLDVPKGQPGDRLIEWIGGCFETNWSVNPSWKATFESIPVHPVTRGVRPFVLADEWYSHMRFCEGMRGVTPLLTAVPPDEVHEGDDGPYSGNPVMRSRKGQSEHLAWAFERAGGGRGFGFAGGHKQWNWAHDDFRKLVLNAMVWLAGAEVPPDGVQTPRPDTQRLLLNFEKPVPSRINFARFDKLLDELNAPAQDHRTNSVPASPQGRM
jgi:hypothetical protein